MTNNDISQTGTNGQMGCKCSPCDRPRQHPARGIVKNSPTCLALEAGLFDTVYPDGDCVFCIAKQMDRTNLDVIGENCVRNDAGELALSDDDKMKAWVEHYARLIKVEFEWPSN